MQNKNNYKNNNTNFTGSICGAYVVLQIVLYIIYLEYLWRISCVTNTININLIMVFVAHDMRHKYYNHIIVNSICDALYAPQIP